MVQIVFPRKSKLLRLDFRSDGSADYFLPQVNNDLIPNLNFSFNILSRLKFKISNRFFSF